MADHQATSDEREEELALRISRSLHGRPDYQQALEDADRESIDGPTVDVADFLSKLHGRGTHHG